MAIATAVVVILAAGGIAVGRKVMAKPVEREQIIPPSVFEVETGSVDQRVTASGTTMATEETSIFIELSQTVDQVYAEVGDFVEEGQLLVTYDIKEDKEDLLNKLEQAKISLENAQLSLKEIAEPATGTELLDLKSQVISAEKNLRDAETEIVSYGNKVTDAEIELKNKKKTMEDNEELLKVGGVSQSEYDSSKDDYEKALTALEEAKQNKLSKEESIESLTLALEKAEMNLENSQNRLNDPSTANSYQKQQNSVRTAQMEIESIQNNLSKLTEATYSPISGTIIESNAVEGQMLTDSTVMMKVADLTQMDLEAYVSEYDIAKIQVGQKVELTSDGIEDKIYHGTVTKIEPTAESRSTISGSETVVPIKVHMEDNDDLVKPGFSFDMEIIVTDLENVNYIPISAILKEGEETFVYRVEEGEMVRKTQVNLGIYSDVYAEVLEGLTAGDRIMTSPDGTVQDNTPLMDYAQKTTSKQGTTKETNSILDGMSGGMTSGGGYGGGVPGGGPGGGGFR